MTETNTHKILKSQYLNVSCDMLSVLFIKTKCQLRGKFPPGRDIKDETCLILLGCETSIPGKKIQGSNLVFMVTAVKRKK